MTTPVMLFEQAKQSRALLVHAREYVRDDEGRFAEVPDVDVDIDLDLDEDDEDRVVDSSDLDSINQLVPDEYRAKYGKVIAQHNIHGEANTNEFDVDVVVTEKGGLHISDGLAGRRVLVELNPDSARALADLVYNLDDYELPHTDGATGIRFGDWEGAGNGKSPTVAVTWPNGVSYDFTENQLAGMQESLDMAADDHEEAFGARVSNRVVGVRPGEHGGKHSGSLFERARATRQRLAEIAAKYDPNQRRDDDGRWSDGTPGPDIDSDVFEDVELDDEDIEQSKQRVPADRAKDKARVDKQLVLRPGENLVASRGVRTSDGDTSLLALTDGPDGKALRVGFVASHEKSRWTGEQDHRTALVPHSEFARLRNRVAELPDRMKNSVAEYRRLSKAADASGAYDVPDGQRTAAQQAAADAANLEGAELDGGVLASGPWGDLRWAVMGWAADDPGQEYGEVHLGVVPAGGSLGEVSSPFVLPSGSSVRRWVDAVTELSAGAAAATRGGSVVGKYNPDQRRDSDGKWADVPGVGVDKLGLGKRIQLGEGEKLLSSRKVKSTYEYDTDDLLAAEVDTPSGREIRVGIIDGETSKRWKAAPPSAEAARRHAFLDVQLAELSEDDPAYDELWEERHALEGELVGTDRTATVAPASVGAMQAELAAGVADAKRWADDLDRFWRDNPNPSQAEIDAMGDADPTLMSGSVPVDGGRTLQYEVVGDGEDTPATWRVQFGIRPADADEDWFIGADDAAARFAERDVRGLLESLAELTRGSAVPANRLSVLLGEFDEGKHKRDRRGRFAKSAAQVVSELDDLMAKLSALTKDLGDDEDDNGEAETALEALRDLRDRQHEKATRRSAVIDTSQLGEVKVLIHDDGDVGVEWNEADDAFWFPPGTAKELAAGLDKLRTVDAPDREKGQDSAVVGKVTSSNGEFAVARWNTGIYDVGPAGSVGVEDPEEPVVELDGAEGETLDFADLLEEMADRSLAGQPSNSVAVLPWNHPGGPGHVQKDRRDVEAMRNLKGDADEA